jgi:hypothetical protein
MSQDGQGSRVMAKEMEAQMGADCLAYVTEKLKNLEKISLHKRQKISDRK